MFCSPIGHLDKIAEGGGSAGSSGSGSGSAADGQRAPRGPLWPAAVNPSDSVIASSLDFGQKEVIQSNFPDKILKDQDVTAVRIISV